MHIDTTAPVTATGSITIQAPSSRVWQLLTDINNWPDWNPDIQSATLIGAVQPGSTMVWKAGPGTITSQLQHVDRQKELGWTGKTIGIKAVHVWRLQTDGKNTLVITEESWRGWPVMLFKKAAHKQLDKALQNSLRYLKRAAEDASSGNLA